MSLRIIQDALKISAFLKCGFWTLNTQLIIKLESYLSYSSHTCISFSYRQTADKGLSLMSLRIIQDALKISAFLNCGFWTLNTQLIIKLDLKSKTCQIYWVLYISSSKVFITCYSVIFPRQI